MRTRYFTAATADPDRVQALMDRNDKLEAQLAEAKAVLREVEWASQETDEGGSLPPQCMACDQYHHQGHAPDCRLARVLEGT